MKLEWSCNPGQPMLVNGVEATPEILEAARRYCEAVDRAGTMHVLWENWIQIEEAMLSKLLSEGGMA